MNTSIAKPIVKNETIVINETFVADDVNSTDSTEGQKEIPDEKTEQANANDSKDNIEKPDDL